MYKVISVDNLNRDYQPQKQITLAMELTEACKVADLLNNQTNGNNYYKVVPDNQELNLESMYHLTGEVMPYNYWCTLTGANALPQLVAEYWYETTILNKKA